MPNYVVSHKIDLTEDQRLSIAQAITRIHSTMFTTPELFVNVQFRPSSQTISYTGGKPHTSNSITGFVRHNSTRTQEQYADLCNRIGAAWKDVFPDDSGDRKLGAIFIQGSILAGWEQGVMIPQAGDDKNWLKQHWALFKKRADEGDEDMKGLVADIERRKLIAA